MSDRCGTYAGYQAHRRRQEPACQPCRDANAAYAMQLRRTRPEVRDRAYRYNRARNHALERLAREHPARFLQLFTEERRKEPA